LVKILNILYIVKLKQVN